MTQHNPKDNANAYNKRKSFKWNVLNQEEDPLVSKRKNTADEFELTMSQK